MKQQSISFPKLLFYGLSPLLSFPFVIIDVFHNRKNSLLILTLFFAVLSYAYIPNFSNDRVRYLEFYQGVKDLNFETFLNLGLEGRADFVLYVFIYLLAHVGMSFHVIVTIITFITVGVILLTIKLFFNYYKVSDLNQFYGIILFILAISYTDLFSGIRFYFSTAFVLLSVYYFLAEKKYNRAIFIMLISVFIHFSALIYFVVIGIYFLLNNKPKMLKWFFILSFLFLFFDLSFITEKLDLSLFGQAVDLKKTAYLLDEDFVENGIQENKSILYISIVSRMSYYLFCAYLLVTNTKISALRNFIFVLIASMNLLYSQPTIFLRYLLALKLFALILVVLEATKQSHLKYVFSLVFLFLLGLLTNIVVMREIIAESYFNIENLFINNLLFRERQEFIF
jgi:hypothetical protein